MIVEVVEEVFLVRIQLRTSGIFPTWIQAWDSSIFILVNECMASAYLDPIMWVLAKLGSTTFWLALSAFLWIRKRKRDAVLVAAGVVIGGLLILPVKILLPRARPYLVLEGARALEMEGGGSFPSGHSKNGFTIAAIFGDNRRMFAVPMYALVFLIALSRVYVGMHWPSDVIAGSVLGWVVGKTTVHYESKVLSMVKGLGL